MSRLAFYFGALELCFVFLVAGYLPKFIFVVLASGCCLALMRDYIFQQEPTHAD